MLGGIHDGHNAIHAIGGRMVAILPAFGFDGSDDDDDDDEEEVGVDDDDMMDSEDGMDEDDEMHEVDVFDEEDGMDDFEGEDMLESSGDPDMDSDAEDYMLRHAHNAYVDQELGYEPATVRRNGSFGNDNSGFNEQLQREELFGVALPLDVYRELAARCSFLYDLRSQGDCTIRLEIVPSLSVNHHTGTRDTDCAAPSSSRSHEKGVTIPCHSEVLATGSPQFLKALQQLWKGWKGPKLDGETLGKAEGQLPSTFHADACTSHTVFSGPSVDLTGGEEEERREGGEKVATTYADAGAVGHETVSPHCNAITNGISKLQQGACDGEFFAPGEIRLACAEADTTQRGTTSPRCEASVSKLDHLDAKQDGDQRMMDSTDASSSKAGNAGHSIEASKEGGAGEKEVAEQSLVPHSIAVARVVVDTGTSMEASKGREAGQEEAVEESMVFHKDASSSQPLLLGSNTGSEAREKEATEQSLILHPEASSSQSALAGTKRAAEKEHDVAGKRVCEPLVHVRADLSLSEPGRSVLNVILEQGDVAAFQRMIKFFYCASVDKDLTGSELLKLLQIAERFQATHCCEAVLQIVSMKFDSLSPTEFCSCCRFLNTKLIWCCEFRIKLIMKLRNEYRDAIRILDDPQLLSKFCGIPWAAVRFVLTDEQLQVDNENTVACLLDHWLCTNPEVSTWCAAKLQNVVKEIRSRILYLGRLSPVFLEGIAHESSRFGSLTPEEKNEILQIRIACYPPAPAALHKAGALICPLSWYKQRSGYQITSMRTTLEVTESELREALRRYPEPSSFVGKPKYAAGWYTKLIFRISETEPSGLHVVYESAAPSFRGKQVVMAKNPEFMVTNGGLQWSPKLLVAKVGEPAGNPNVLRLERSNVASYEAWSRFVHYGKLAFRATVTLML